MLVSVAIGSSRHQSIWKNKDLAWIELVQRLSETTRTKEKISQYLKESPARQSEIKDVGGFVGGFLVNGRRKKKSVLFRQIICLDADFATSDFWELFTTLYGIEAVLYSTHKHTPESPRLRLVIPLDREVDSEQYEAISRRVADTIGLDLFDPSTYQPERLMYWPSTASDGEFLFKHQKGPFLEADEVLGSYRDWRDISSWPFGDLENTAVNKAKDIAEDPLEKDNLIGDFCRAYSIADAISDHLDTIYTPTDIPGRFTYAQGSTAGGLVVYDDKFCFSHHGTDPASGQLLNAFDLVRVHRFLALDESTPVTTNITKRPSYAAMEKLAASDPKTKIEAAKRIFKNAGEEFTDVDLEWFQKLDLDKKGSVLGTIKNICTILENDSGLKGVFGFNEFTHRKVLLKDAPWRKMEDRGSMLRDEDLQNLTKYLEASYAILNRSNMADAFDTHIDANAFHPIRDYLLQLQPWDGVPRVETILVDYLGALDCEHTREITRKTLTAAVARVLVPGIKFDHMLILSGCQGIGKSTLVSKLAGDWFNDSFSFHQIGKNEASEQIIGSWIIEVGELTGLKKTEIEGVKHFISKQEEQFRQAYKHYKEFFKRQCVFIGTTNEENFLRDATGNRRFWPVSVGELPRVRSVHDDIDEETRDQIWAEALYYWTSGEKLYLSRKAEDEARRQAEAFNEVDERLGIIESFLDIKLPEGWDGFDLQERLLYFSGVGIYSPDKDGVHVRESVSLAELWCEALKGDFRQINTYNTRPIGDLMRKVKGWERSKQSRSKIYGKQITYRRIENKQN